MPQILSQVEIENEGQRLAHRLEEAKTALRDRAMEAARADAEYRKVHAQQVLLAEAPTVGEREARATIAASDVYLARRIAEAKQLSAQEACRNYRAQLDWLRSLAANVRAQVTG